MNEKDEREQFEAWLLEIWPRRADYALKRDEEGLYFAGHIQEMWSAWQAARRLSAPRGRHLADLIDTLEQLRAVVGTPEQNADALIAAVRRLSAPAQPLDQLPPYYLSGPYPGATDNAYSICESDTARIVRRFSLDELHAFAAGAPAQPVAYDEHDQGIIRDLQKIARDGDNEFWLRMLALGALRLIRESAQPNEPHSVNPIDMVLHCPKCGRQMADVATNSVAAIKTKGKDDSPIVNRGSGQDAVAVGPDDQEWQLVPKKPTVWWFQRVVYLAGVWPDEKAPIALWQAVQKYHAAMLSAAPRQPEGDSTA